MCVCVCALLTDTDVVLRKLVAVTMVRVVDNKLEIADYCDLDMDYFVGQTFFIGIFEFFFLCRDFFKFFKNR